MAEFLHAVSAVFLIFSLMAVGYFLGRAGWMKASDKKFISRYAINLAVPANCLTGVLNNFHHEDLNFIGKYLMVPILSITILLFLSMGAATLLKLPRKRWGVFVSMAFISNTIFIGLPVTQQLFGDAGIPYIMIFYMGSTIFTQSVAVLLCEHAGSEEVKHHSVPQFLLDIVKKPPIIGVVCSFTLLYLNLRPPELVMSFAKYISQTLSPLALMYCGFVVYEMGIRNVRMEKGIPLMLFIRLLLSPALCFLLCRAVGAEGLAANVFIIAAALPVVTQITVLAGEFGADEKYAVTGAVLSTLGIFITIPIFMVLF